MAALSALRRSVSHRVSDLQHLRGRATYNKQVRQGYNTELSAETITRHPQLALAKICLLQVYEPARLARELLDSGITAMKIWPFDVFALRNGAAEISRGDLHKAIWPIEQIRNEVGDSMDIMIEYHGPLGGCRRL